MFISHALEEALTVSDWITILRDGKHVVTDQTVKFDRASIVKAMVGRDLSQTLYGQRKKRRDRQAGASCPCKTFVCRRWSKARHFPFSLVRSRVSSA